MQPALSLCEICSSSHMQLFRMALSLCEICSFFVYATFSHGSFPARSRSIEISSWSVRPLALRSCKLCVRYCSTFSHGSISAPVPTRTGASLCEIVRLLALACEICSWLCKCNCNHEAGSFSVRDLLFFAYATFSHGSFSARSCTCWNWLVSVRDCAITSSGLRNLLLSLYLGTSCNGI